MRTAAGDEERCLQGKDEFIGHHIVGKERHEVVNGANEVCTAQQKGRKHWTGKMTVAMDE